MVSANQAGTQGEALSPSGETAEKEEAGLVQELPREAPNAAPGKKLTPAAKRALEEAEQRRLAEAADKDSDAQAEPVEYDGQAGPEPTRYGDWEKKGIATDFS